MAVETIERVLVAKMDTAGRIVSADEPILQLQHAAGGDPDGPLAVPPIASVARLARRLGVLIARPLLIGGAERDVRAWIRAAPTADGVELRISEWLETPHADEGHHDALRAADIALADDGAEWRTDAQMRLVGSGPLADIVPVGSTFLDAFGKVGAAQPLREKVAARRPFFALPARDRHGQRWLLSGHPLFDADGAFLGYRGKASPTVEEESGDAGPPSSATPPGVDLPDFGKRIDVVLRQPLGRIVANAETISGQIEGPLRADYAAYAADIANAGRHLMELVDDIADLQAIDRPDFKVASEEVDMADLARRASGLLSMRAADRHIRVDVPAADESLPATGEFRRALQIIVNLLSNAIRYAPEHSTVWVRADADQDRAMLIVADQGHGIAPEDQERIFDKFERLGREDVAGSGLGLYISRRLARAMKGDLRVESAPGQGARFILSLPLRPMQ